MWITTSQSMPLTTRASPKEPKSNPLRRASYPSLGLMKSIVVPGSGSKPMNCQVCRATPFFTALAAVLCISISNAFGAVSMLKELPDGIQFTVDGGTLRIQIRSDSVTHVTYAASTELPPTQSLSVVGTPSPARWTRQESDHPFIP